jgi:GT2 family glycosyltransferase
MISPHKSDSEASPLKQDGSAPPLDVVIVNYNSTDALLAALESAYRALGPETRIFVQDNASGDQPQRIRESYPQARLSLNRDNLGFAKAVNQALAQGGAPYVMLLNPDTLLAEQDYFPLWDFLDENPEVGVLGPRILDPDGSVQGSARGFHTLTTALAGRKGLLTRLFPDSRLARQDLPCQDFVHGEAMEVDWVSGACMVVRREAMEQVGGLDERFFMYFEDTDWCRRMKSAGWRTMYFPSVEVVHQVGVSKQSRPLRCEWEFHKSCYRYMNKYELKTKPWVRPLAAALLGARLAAVLGAQGCGRIWRQLGGSPGGHNPGGQGKASGNDTCR